MENREGEDIALKTAKDTWKGRPPSHQINKIEQMNTPSEINEKQEQGIQLQVRGKAIKEKQKVMTKLTQRDMLTVTERSYCSFKGDTSKLRLISMLENQPHHNENNSTSALLDKVGSENAHQFHSTYQQWGTHKYFRYFRILAWYKPEIHYKNEVLYSKTVFVKADSKKKSLGIWTEWSTQVELHRFLFWSNQKEHIQSSSTTAMVICCLRWPKWNTSESRNKTIVFVSSQF